MSTTTAVPERCSCGCGITIDWREGRIWINGRPYFPEHVAVREINGDAELVGHNPFRLMTSREP